MYLEKLIALTLFFGKVICLLCRGAIKSVCSGILRVLGVSFSPHPTFVCVQGTGRRSAFRCGKWRIIPWTSTTWWTSPCPWTTTWITSAIWAPSWRKRCESSRAISVWGLAPSWTKTFLLSPTRHQDTKTIPASGECWVHPEGCSLHVPFLL